jgi:hypothetical protein
MYPDFGNVGAPVFGAFGCALAALGGGPFIGFAFAAFGGGPFGAAFAAFGGCPFGFAFAAFGGGGAIAAVGFASAAFGGGAFGFAFAADTRLAMKPVSSGAAIVEPAGGPPTELAEGSTALAEGSLLASFSVTLSGSSLASGSGNGGAVAALVMICNCGTFGCIA